MKHNMKNMMAAGLLMAALALTGCGGDASADAGASEPLYFGVVMAAREDFPEVELGILQPYLTQFVEYGGTLVLTVSDGNPANNTHVYTSKGVDTSKEKSWQTKTIRERLNAVEGVLWNAAATSPEAATLEAMRVTVNSLHDAAPADANIQLIILDNGLQTTGALPLLSLQNLDATGQVEKLSTQFNIPDLKGIAVTWYGLGDVSTRYDAAMPALDVQNLKSLWGGICSTGGASVTFSERSIRAQQTSQERSLPKVSKCAFSDIDTSIVTTISAITEMPTTTATSLTEPIVINEEVVKFEPNQCDLDAEAEATAKEKLQYVAQTLCRSNQEVLLIGCIATVKSDDQGVSFSTRRAETVKQLLVDLGVPASNIHTAGAGCTDRELTIDDLNADGSLNPEKAQENRKVLLLPLTEAYQPFIDRYLWE